MNREEVMEKLNFYKRSLEIMENIAAALDNRDERLVKQMDEIRANIDATEKELADFRNGKRAVGKTYYKVVVGGFIWEYAMHIVSDKDTESYSNNTDFQESNYFPTEERAEQVLGKIKAMLKIERMHDVHCPNYEPNDWDKTFYSISYNQKLKRFYPCHMEIKLDGVTYFKTVDMVKEVCDVLNGEVRI